MTESLFFDTDCLSAFLWINNQSLLAQLYSGQIIIPEQVYEELSNPMVSHLKDRVDLMIARKDARIESIQTDTVEYKLYRKMTFKPDHGHVIIGKGEAAAIAMAKERRGILASNNLKDISVYIDEFGLENLTTGDILREAFIKGLITEDEGNRLWSEMLKKRRKLGFESFSSFLRSNL